MPNTRHYILVNKKCQIIEQEGDFRDLEEARFHMPAPEGAALYVECKSHPATAECAKNEGVWA